MFGLDELDFKLDLSGRPSANKRGVEEARWTDLGPAGFVGV
jgi:hypothetical protein